MIYNHWLGLLLRHSSQSHLNQESKKSGELLGEKTKYSPTSQPPPPCPGKGRQATDITLARTGVWVSGLTAHLRQTKRSELRLKNYAKEEDALTVHKNVRTCCSARVPEDACNTTIQRMVLRDDALCIQCCDDRCREHLRQFSNLTGIQGTRWDEGMGPATRGKDNRSGCDPPLQLSVKTCVGGGAVGAWGGGGGRQEGGAGGGLAAQPGGGAACDPLLPHAYL